MPSSWADVSDLFVAYVSEKQKFRLTPHHWALSQQSRFLQYSVAHA